MLGGNDGRQINAAVQNRVNVMTQQTYQQPSRQEVLALINQANQLRAEALRTMYAGLGRRISSVARAAVAAVVGFGQAFAEARRAQHLYEQLSQMSAHELADIGLTRGDIPAVVAGVFRRDGDVAPAEAVTTAPAGEVTELKRVPAARPAADIREAA